MEQWGGARSPSCGAALCLIAFLERCERQIRRASDCPVRCADEHDCTTRQRNAHRTGIECELLYPWHPWTGRQVHIHEVIEKGDAAVFRCSVSGQASDRWLEVPGWMFDRILSASWGIWAAPHVDLAVLGALAALLDDTGEPSQSRRIDAASDDHDPNRGDVHAARAHDTSVRSVLQLCSADRADPAMAGTAGRDAPTADLADGAPNPRPRRRRSVRITGGLGS